MNNNCKSNLPNQLNKNAQSTIYLLRHGEIEKNGILCGHSDIPLSEKGWHQLEQATKHLHDIHIDVAQCYSSPLLRCVQFAQQWTNVQNIPLSINAQLKEMNFGDWDGQSYESLWEETSINPPRTPHNIGKFWQNPWENPNPNGETMENFCQRIDDFWQTLLLQSKNKNSLVISHGGVIKHILARVFNMPIPGNNHFNTFTIPYASLITINVHYDDNGNVWPSVQL